MSSASASLSDYLAAETAAIASACTACGKCVEVCPVVPYAGLAEAVPANVVGGVLDLLRHDTPLSDDAAAWAGQCNGCGDCIPACPEGVNPRRMLMLANTVDARNGNPTPELFRKMARAVRLMAAMQLVPEEFSRAIRLPRARPASVIFYLGCNALRTPHLLFNAMYVLDAMEVDYEVVGGPGACCGIIHAKWEGEIKAGERVTDGTLTRFEDFEPDKVLSWCPSCQLHLGETVEGFRQTSFDFEHVTTFLVEQAEKLRAKLVRPLERRVLLHAHDGMGDLGRNVAELLGAIPGLTLVDTHYESGYTCGGSGSDRSPGLKAAQRAELQERLGRGDVDTLVTLYHGCHRSLTEEERDGLRVLNFTDLLVEALGAEPHEDVFKRYRLLDDWKLIAEEGEAYLKANGIDLDPIWLQQNLPELFSMAEFKGGLECFGTAR